VLSEFADLHTAADLDAVAKEINNPPRQVLAWKTRSEALSGHVALIV
jgi:IS30 family transposase